VVQIVSEIGELSRLVDEVRRTRVAVAGDGADGRRRSLRCRWRCELDVEAREREDSDLRLEERRYVELHGAGDCEGELLGHKLKVVRKRDAELLEGEPPQRFRATGAPTTSDEAHVYTYSICLRQEKRHYSKTMCP